MLIGAMIAVLLTVFAAWTRIGADLLALLTLTLYSVPAIALLPLLILWFDTSPTSLVVVTVCSVTLPTAINLSAGLKSVNPTIMLVGQNLGLRGWGMFSAVLLPAALPHAISGLRAGWASGWRTVIAAGLVFGVAGGGPTFFTNDAGDFLLAPELLAGLLTIAFRRSPGRSDLPPAGARYRRPMGNERLAESNDQENSLAAVSNQKAESRLLPALDPLTFHKHLDHFGAGELWGRVLAPGEHLAHLRPREEDVGVWVVRAGLDEPMPPHSVQKNACSNKRGVIPSSSGSNSSKMCWAS